MLDRREFLSALAAGAMLASRPLRAQQSAPPATSMSGDGYLPVRLPPKPGATARLTALERDAVERSISCPCPCTLDVFTCRTSMPCGFSPRMHTDVVALAEGGYTADEILAAFVATYGETARMAPSKQGFNLVGWGAPFAALGTGAIVVAALVRRWGRRARAGAVDTTTPTVEASSDELARLEAAVRGERE
jgi:cytochrome c-type biogenesis protein CcmH